MLNEPLGQVRMRLVPATWERTLQAVRAAVPANVQNRRALLMRGRASEVVNRTPITGRDEEGRRFPWAAA